MASPVLDKQGLIHLWSKLKGLFAGKVDKVEGKSLTTNDFTDAYKGSLDNLNTNLDAKVDKIEGKGLSANDFTDAEKTKLGNLKETITWADVTSKPELALKSDISQVYKYKGSVEAVANLPADNNVIGDVYNVEANDMNYAWDGTKWDPLGSTFQLDVLSNSDIDNILSA